MDFEIKNGVLVKFKGKGDEVIIPEGVKKIQKEAFDGFNTYMSVTLPESLEVIEEDAFEYSKVNILKVKSLDQWLSISMDNYSCSPLRLGGILKINEEEVEKLVLPDGLTKIRDYAFLGCSFLKELVIPESVTEIGKSAFQDCNGLHTFNLPKELKSIGACAFQNTKIAEIQIPDSVATIGYGAFAGCKELVEVKLPGQLAEIEHSMFMNSSSLQVITLPETIVKIGGRAFAGCGIHSLAIPSSITTIASEAFSKSAIVEIVLPDSIEEIETKAFEQCHELQKVSLSRNLKSIKSWAFNGCGNIKEVHVPSWTTWLNIEIEIGGSPLRDSTLFIDGNKVDTLDGILGTGINKISKYWFSGCNNFTDLVIPSEITSIESYAFSGCKNLKSVSVMGNTSIGSSAFSDCSSLKQINLPESLETISSYLFKGCTSLENITIAEQIKEIGKEAFADCTGLVSVDLKGPVKIEDGAFKKCSNLNIISISSNLKEIQRDAFIGCVSIKEVIIDNLKSWLDLKMGSRTSNPLYPISVGSSGPVPQKAALRIGESIVESLSIPEETDKIRSSAFEGCSSIKTVIIPPSVESIESNAFSATCITEITFSDGLKTIGTSAFNKSKLKSVVFPSSIEEISDSAFSACEDLITVQFESVPAKLGKEVFYGCNKDIHFVFPANAFAQKNKMSAEWANYNLSLSDSEIAHILMFQTAKAWKSCINSMKISNPELVFSEMIILYESNKKASPDELADFMTEYSEHLDSEMVKKALTLLKANKYKGVSKLEKTPEIMDALSGKEVEQNPAESLVKEFMTQPGKEILPGALKFAKKGVPYAKDGRLCSTDVIAFIVSESMREWDRVKSVYGPFATEYLQNGTTVNFSPEAIQLGKELNSSELSTLLEGFIEKPTYRPCLIAWGYFATDESIAKITSTYKTMINGNSKDSTKAGNIREVLLKNDTRGAMLFFDRINDLDRYAALHGMSAMAMRDSIMLPAFDFDEEGKKCYDIGGNTIEVSISQDLDFRIFDVNANKEVRSFPKKSADPTKAKTCDKDFTAFKKEVLTFAKLRSELLHKMHISGEYVEPELWHKVYEDHPVIKHLAQLVVWEDESGKTFMIDSGKLISATGQEYVPQGKIRVAHVLEMDQADVSLWQNKLAKSGKKQLFEQIWEPIIPWTESDIKSRYMKVTLTGEERNALKKSLKLRGVDVQSGYMEREYNYRKGQYEFSNEGSMGFGNCMRVDYVVDPETKKITFGKATALVKPGDREINAVVLELDKATVSSQVVQDNDASVNMQALSVFTASQISSLLNLAIEKKAERCTALLLNYKNEHFPEFADVNEFSLDW